ncbi:hypothetical protein A8F94_10195 [Bacillus sp. FJAT-27225]|uniref:DUF6241 domain-containing protein n=1 Tax=Bacillus sp. FJAT-27225 TaxID=1743144 RepID=UPI00080C2090|nr:DUF6241 domain-containing protein [Bacillus sp. FJAT-27225]OCA88170.1 hypothetical protein A8F94_10195 [Bacillus sp. FJAT-27225]
MERPKRKSRNKKKILLAVFATLLVLFGAGLLVSDFLTPKSKVKVKTDESISTLGQEGAGSDGASAYLIVDTLSPAELEKELPSTMRETTMQNNIHFMSHQKVRADDKWGSVPLTEQRVDRLLAILEAKKFKHEALYLDILTRWKEGDFSRVDKDHNAIWDLLGGTVGKAYGILSAEEEKKYIEKYYDTGN